MSKVASQIEIRQGAPITLLSPDVGHFMLTGGSALVLWSTTTGRASYAHLSEDREPEGLLRACELQLGEPRHQISIWYLHSSRPKALRIDTTATLGFHNVRIAHYDSNAEVYFYPESGRFRVRELIEAVDRIQVVIVDDSPTSQKVLAKLLQADPEIEVAGIASHPDELEALIEGLSPDVLTMDIHMPGVDGVTLLKRVYPRFKIPTVMISSLSREDGDHVLRALEAGAFDYIQKPALSELSVVGPVICEKIKIAARSKVVASTTGVKFTPNPSDILFPQYALSHDRIMAIGASTGGVSAIGALFETLGEKVPPIVIAQHIPELFSGAFATRLNEVCAFEVREGADGDLLKSGVAYVAKGGHLTEVAESPDGYRLRVWRGGHEYRFQPSIDALFESVAHLYGRRAIGILLTGMGADGASGLLKIRRAGGVTLAQDAESSAVDGMPRAARELGAAESVCSPQRMVESIIQLLAIRHDRAA